MQTPDTPKKDEPIVHPLEVIEGWRKRIENYPIQGAEMQRILEEFLYTCLPYFRSREIRKLADAYTTLVLEDEQAKTSKPVITDFLDWHLKELGENAKNRSPSPATNYPVQKAFLELVNQPTLVSTLQSWRREIACELFKLVQETDFQDPLFTADKFKDHLCSFRLAVLGSLSIKDFNVKLLTSALFFKGLDLIADRMDEVRILHDEKRPVAELDFDFDGNEHHTPNSYLGHHYFSLLDLRDRVYPLGKVQKQIENSNQPLSKPREKRDIDFENQRLVTIGEQQRIRYRESAFDSERWLTQAAKHSVQLASLSDLALEDEIDRLSRGDRTSELSKIPLLKDLLNAGRSVIRRAVRGLSDTFARANVPHPVQNPIFTFSQLITAYREIAKIDQLLAYELLLIILTGIAPSRFESRSSAMDGADSTQGIYFKSNQFIVFTLKGTRDSGDQTHKPTDDKSHETVIALRLNPGLLRALHTALDNSKMDQLFSGFSSRYRAVKKILQRQNITLPRNPSQWTHVAREVLGPHLCDYELDLIAGSLHFRNRVPHAYITTDLVALNKRYALALNAFLDRLTPSIRLELPLSEHPQITELPESIATRIGSYVTTNFAAVNDLINQINACAQTIQRELYRAQRARQQTSHTVLKALNLMSLNLALMTNLATSGRWNHLRSHVTRTPYGMRIEDKDSARHVEVRSCATTLTENSFMTLWDEQTQAIDGLLAYLKKELPSLGIDWASIEQSHHYCATQFTLALDDTGYTLSAQPMGEAELLSVLEELNLTTERFPLNTLRHCVLTQGITRLPRSVLNQQTGHSLPGQDHLSPSSSGKFSALTLQTSLIGSLADRLGIKVLRLGFHQKEISHAR